MLHLHHEGATQGTATVLGHIELHLPAFGNVVVLRRESIEALALISKATECRAEGVAIDRHEIVAYALIQLDEN